MDGREPDGVDAQARDVVQFGEDPGQASDIQIEAEEIVKMRERVNRMIAKETGQPYEKIVKDTQRNFWMSAEAAVEYGLVSKIIHSATEA